MPSLTIIFNPASKISIKFKNSPGVIWAVSKNTKSNFIFNCSKNICGNSPVNKRQFLVNSGKYCLTLYPVSYLGSKYNLLFKSNETKKELS